MSLEDGVRRFLQWYGEYYDVPLPPSMTPTRHEATELRVKYNIVPTKMRGKRKARGI